MTAILYGFFEKGVADGTAIAAAAVTSCWCGHYYGSLAFQKIIMAILKVVGIMNILIVQSLATFFLNYAYYVSLIFAEIPIYPILCDCYHISLIQCKADKEATKH